ncbi:MAG TPA: diaminopimelate epimerase [Bacteroidales bacterium]|nr:diaminopimelate epimerase [Bacteroidales bacterium]HPS62152.1 diaminopimelate epimerase [Bacteroidales bacterium]
MKIKFEKYQGAGNDFILIDNRFAAVGLTTEEIARLCHRRFGIGADGLMLLSQKEGYDFSMTYYNADGNESTLCGNGGRCMTAFAKSLGLVSDRARFFAADGEHLCDIADENGKWIFRLKMRDTSIGRIYDDGIFLDTGSPHFVRFGTFPDLDVVHEGRRLRFDPRFEPGGANINFASAGNEVLFVRTYERGVEDETLSCGTGVTASALAYAFRNNTGESRCLIETRGGRLSVRFQRSGDRFTDVWLEGPAEFVFRGEVIC